MNVYDVLSDLEKALKGSHEYTAMKAAREKIHQDADAEKMVKDFLAKKQELEIAQFTGQKPSKEAMDNAQKLYEVISLNPVAMEYIQAYMRIQMLLSDISKSVGNVIKEAVEG